MGDLGMISVERLVEQPREADAALGDLEAQHRDQLFDLGLVHRDLRRRRRGAGIGN